MTDPKTDPDIFARLDDLLDRERAALITGDLSAIAHLLEEKERLLEQVEKEHAPGPAALESLQGKALRNQALLDSALLGIRTVATRFATLRRIRRTLETYDAHGQKTALPAALDNKVEKRA